MFHVKQSRRAFTIIELMLAMTFISVLLVLISFTIIQIGTIYNKGMTLKEVNQTGRAISDDINRNLSAGRPFTLATNYFNTPNVSGRLCLGNYTYIWNYADALSSGNTNVARYAGLPLTTEQIRLVKVPDAGALYCVRSGGAFVNRDIRAQDRSLTTELLKSGDRLLSIHQFSLTTSAAGTDALTSQQLYNATFTIGTGDVTALNTARTSCLPPGNINSNFSFCAVQQFKLVMRAGNRVN